MVVDGKSNEIIVIFELLMMLDIESSIFILDVMGC